MTASSEVQLHIDLMVRGGRLDGALDDGHGQPVSFVGWIGLVSAIDRATRGHEQGDGASALHLLGADDGAGQSLPKESP